MRKVFISLIILLTILSPVAAQTTITDLNVSTPAIVAEFGSETSPAYTFQGDEDSGFFTFFGGITGATSDGVTSMLWSQNGLAVSNTTATLATYTFLDDAGFNTGLKYRGENMFDLVTTGVSRIFLDPVGHVGINTSTPNQALEVQGNVNVSGTVFASNISSNSPLTLKTSGITRMFFDDVTGFVGIGTIVPATALDVNGNITGDFFFGDGSLLSGIPVFLGDVFVNETGDTMTGNLIVLANGSFQSIFADDWLNVTVTESQISDLVHTVDTNETGRITNLTSFDCPGGQLVIGVQTNGTVLCALDAGAGAGNSLDQAYDQGGSGLGRFINVDSGPVELNYSGANGVFVINTTSGVQSGNFIGIDLNLRDNFDISAGSQLFGIRSRMSDLNNSAALSKTIQHINIDTSGVYEQSNAGGDVQWSGIRIDMPAMRESLGQMIATGLDIRGGSSLSGTAPDIRGLAIDMVVDTEPAIAITDGRVGIGTSTPQADLHIFETGSDAHLRLEFAGGGGGTLDLKDLSATGQLINASDALTISGESGITLENAFVQMVIIDSSGTQIVGSNATAGLPAYRFSGDSDTGFFNPADDVTAYSSGAVNVINFTSTGVQWSQGTLAGVTGTIDVIAVVDTDFSLEGNTLVASSNQAGSPEIRVGDGFQFVVPATIDTSAFSQAILLRPNNILELNISQQEGGKVTVIHNLDVDEDATIFGMLMANSDRVELGPTNITGNLNVVSGSSILNGTVTGGNYTFSTDSDIRLIDAGTGLLQFFAQGVRAVQVENPSPSANTYVGLFGNVASGEAGITAFREGTASVNISIHGQGGGLVHVDDPIYIDGIAADGLGKVVCILSDGTLGTCTSTVAAGGTCTCA